MSLPSQSSRNATRSSQVHYRKSSGGPFRKIVTIIVVIALIVLLWYILIRPRTNGPDSSAEQTNAAQGTPNHAGADTSIDTQPIASNTPTNRPIDSAGDSTSRPLPGSGDRPDTNLDVERALGTNTPSTTATPTNTDILAAAAEQGNAEPKTDPSRQPQIEDRTITERNNPAGIRLQLDAARRLVAENNRVQARALLSQTLINANISDSEAQYLRDELTAINEVLLFSPVADPNDPISEMYKIQPGDSLSRIAARRELATHWKLIARINQIADPGKIRLGQNIKLVRGPFHAIINKADYRLDIYHGSPADPDSWLYIRSFDVGLGSNDGTPVGEFVVSANKLENPGWVNPRNAREQYEPDDPSNPIGEYWIGITGVGQYAPLTSLGIHGTIDPASIGSDQSMGCVRLGETDIDIVYELLSEHISRVLIVP